MSAELHHTSGLSVLGKVADKYTAPISSRDARKMVAAHLLAPGGKLLAMKAETVGEEAAQLPPGWQLEAVHVLHVPGLAASRQLAVVGRV